MSWLMRMAAGLVVIALVALTATPSAAQTVAKTQFREAKAAYDKGDYEDALTMFNYAWEQSHSPNARLYIARCLLKLGQLTGAYEEFRGTLREAAAKVEEDEKYLDTRNAAAAELALLEPRLALLVVVLDERVPEATVTMNGDPYPAGKLGTPMAYGPGQFTLVASAEGRKDVTKQVTLTAGQTASVALWFERAEACPPPPPAPPPPPPPEPAGLSSLQIAGAVVLGVGVAGLGIAAAMGGAASSKFGSLEQACGDQRCSNAAQADVVDSGKTYELVSYVSLGAGAGLALLGGGLLLFGGDSADEQTAGFTPLPGGGLLSYGASF